MTIAFLPTYTAGDYGTTKCVECNTCLKGAEAVREHTSWHMKEGHRG